MSDVDKIIEEYQKSRFDFGFSASEQNIEHEIGSREEQISVLKDRLKAVEKMVMPFYVNLVQSKGDTIKWPEAKRKQEMQKQIEALLKLTRT